MDTERPFLSPAGGSREESRAGGFGSQALVCVLDWKRKPEISDFSILIVSAGLSGLRKRRPPFFNLCIQVTESPGLRAALSVSTLCHCGYIVPPSGTGASWAGSDGGDASIAGGSLEPPNVHGNWGKPRAASSLGCGKAVIHGSEGDRQRPQSDISESDSTMEDTVSFRRN